MAREPKRTGIRWRLWLGVALAAIASAGVAAAGLRTVAYVMTDPRFLLSATGQDAVSIEGLVFADGARVRGVFAGDLGRSVFAVPLAERRRRILGIDWVADAAVSRVWPNRLLVRIRERKPVAFVAFPNGPMLVDADGFLLGLPARARFAFPVIDGLHPADSAAQRRQGVAAFLRFEQDMGYLSKEISEVDVADLNDIVVVTRVENRAVELLLGDSDFAARYQNFISHYEEIRKESPDAGTFDLRLDDRITARK
jgi:cell division protein FtsQ